MATFGKTTIGVNVETNLGNTKRLCRFFLPENGEVTSVRIYGRGLIERPAIGVLYSDLNGSPDQLLGMTNERWVYDNLGWWGFTFSTPLKLSSGYYWIGIHTTDRFEIRWDSGEQNQMAWNGDNYIDGPTNPFGSASFLAYAMSVYAVYTPTAPPPATHTLTIQSTPISVLVTVDDVVVGSTPIPVVLTEGSHTIKVPTEVEK